MLKFLRKYQTILLAVAGSLLMVIFLIQPLFQQIGPNPMKRKVAEFGAEGEKVTRGQRYAASVEVQVLEKFFGRQALQNMLSLDEKHTDDHWLLLTHEAEEAGVVGESSEAQLLINSMISAQLRQAVQQRMMFGQTMTPEEQQQLAEQYRDAVAQNRAQIMGANRMKPEDFDGVLTKLRGVMRLQGLFVDALQSSDRAARDGMAEEYAGAFADFVIIGPEKVMDEVPEPTEEQLAAHFAEYETTVAGDTDANPYGIGYKLPARVKLAWLKLDKSAIRENVKVDQIELRKRWQRENPGAPSEQFATDREEIESAMLDEEAAKVIDVADEIVRGELLKWIRTLEREGTGYNVTPEAVQARPSYEDVAATVVTAVKDRTGVTIPLPTVVRRNEKWFTSEELRTLPISSARFTMGSTPVPVASLPAQLREFNESPTLPAQVGVPLIEPYATDFSGSRYYVTVLDARDQSPPDSIDEIRGRVVSDWKSIQAYELLKSRRDEFVSEAQANGLGSVASTGSQVSRDVVVRRAVARPVDQSKPFDRRITQAPTVCEAIVDAAQRLPALEPADTQIEFIGADAPTLFSVAVARVRAQVPVTIEQFRALEENYQAEKKRADLVEAMTVNDEIVYPFSFAALQERYQYKILDEGDED